MSVHSTHYDNQEEYERDLKYEYRKEQYEQDHGIIEDLPFYTDDPDDPHWRCENCGHCKEYKMFKRIINQHPRYWMNDTDVVRHEDHTQYTLWVTRDWKHREMESIWMCELDRTEHLDDDFCDDFKEKD